MEREEAHGGLVFLTKRNIVSFKLDVVSFKPHVFSFKGNVVSFELNIASLELYVVSFKLNIGSFQNSWLAAFGHRRHCLPSSHLPCRRSTLRQAQTGLFYLGQQPTHAIIHTSKWSNYIIINKSNQVPVRITSPIIFQTVRSTETLCTSLFWLLKHVTQR